MPQIQYVTVQGCAGAKCPDCDLSERLLRKAIQLAGLKLPPHREQSRGEFHLADGKALELVHLSCDEAEGRGLDPAGAPFLFVDGKLVVGNEASTPENLSKAILASLFPGGAAAHFDSSLSGSRP